MTAVSYRVAGRRGGKAARALVRTDHPAPEAALAALVGPLSLFQPAAAPEAAPAATPPSPVPAQAEAFRPRNVVPSPPSAEVAPPPAPAFTFDGEVPRLPAVLPPREDPQAWIALVNFADDFDRHRGVERVAGLTGDVMRTWAILWGCSIAEGLIEAPLLVPPSRAWEDFWFEVRHVTYLDASQASASAPRRRHA